MYGQKSCGLKIVGQMVFGQNDIGRNVIGRNVFGRIVLHPRRHPRTLYSVWERPQIENLNFVFAMVKMHSHQPKIN